MCIQCGIYGVTVYLDIRIGDFDALSRVERIVALLHLYVCQLVDDVQAVQIIACVPHCHGVRHNSNTVLCGHIHVAVALVCLDGHIHALDDFGHTGHRVGSLLALGTGRIADFAARINPGCECHGCAPASINPIDFPLNGAAAAVVRTVVRGIAVPA